MKKLQKLFLILFSLALLTVSLLSSTFATLGATYTWQSDIGTVGTFDLSDTQFTIELFGENELYPQSCGRALLECVVLEDYSAEWSISVSNEHLVPIVFYVFDSESNCGFYSCYNYAELQQDSYIEIDNAFIATEHISNDISTLIGELSLGVEICWIWPSKLYMLENESYAESTLDSYQSFRELNNELCKSFATYSFTYPNLKELLSQNKLSYIAINGTTNEQNFDIEQIDFTQFSISENGVIKNGELFCNIFSKSQNSFVATDENYIVDENDYYVFYCSAINPNSTVNALSQTALDFSIIGNESFTPYYKNSTSSAISTQDNHTSGNVVLKLKPCKTTISKLISVTITAEVFV